MKQIVPLYFTLILLHIAHIFEEIAGKFRGIELLRGLGTFLIVNWLLFSAVIVILYWILQGKRWALYFGLLYAGIMVINGMAHNIATIVTSQYYGGFAGGYTGIGLMIIGGLLFQVLLREIRSKTMKS